MNITQQKGLTTELEVQLACIQNGIEVYLPLSADSRCDLIISIEKKLYKVQVKTSRLTESQTGICFNTCSCRMNHTSGNLKQKYSSEDVDFFATTYNNKVYLIPIADCQGTQRTLLFNNKRQNGEKVYFIENYELEKIINNIKNIENISLSKTFVVQIDMVTNKEINRYNTYAEASRALGKGDSGSAHISEATRGKRESAYNYKWKLLTE